MTEKEAIQEPTYWYGAELPYNPTLFKKNRFISINDDKGGKDPYDDPTFARLEDCIGHILTYKNTGWPHRIRYSDYDYKSLRNYRNQIVNKVCLHCAARKPDLIVSIVKPKDLPDSVASKKAGKLVKVSRPVVERFIGVEYYCSKCKVAAMLTLLMDLLGEEANCRARKADKVREEKIAEAEHNKKLFKEVEDEIDQQVLALAIEEEAELRFEEMFVETHPPKIEIPKEVFEKKTGVTTEAVPPPASPLEKQDE